MILTLLSILPLATSCLSTYLIASGTRTQYDPGTGALQPCLVLPPSVVVEYWWTDPDAQWVWFTTHWTTGTFKFIEKFDLAQWAVNRLVRAKLKIAANDYLKVVFNGEILKNFPLHDKDDRFFWEFDLIGRLKGANSIEYKENVMEMYVATEVPANLEGIIYRIEFTFG